MTDPIRGHERAGIPADEALSDDETGADVGGRAVGDDRDEVFPAEEVQDLPRDVPVGDPEPGDVI
jgi:hypothetical protein